jgi:Tfp pilus assembly protein PilX
MPETGKRPRHHLASASEAGFMLVEVLMTSMIVTVVGLGIFLGLEGASHSSGNSKHRSVAAALAQQDQDRMRSLEATDLSNYSERRTVTVAGVPYTVVSNGNWVSDSSGALSCSNTSQRANYIRISSQVSWPSMRTRPAQLESLVAPVPGSFNANQGNLVVRLTDQAGAPVAGVPVSIVPSGATRATEPEGCAVFGALTAGSYDVTYSLPGYVDASGDSTPEHTASVVASASTTQDYQYAEAGTIAVSFDTRVGSNPPQAAPARNLSAVHSGIPGDGIRVFNPADGPHRAIQATALFPFTSAYGVYAGNCAEANPTYYDPSSSGLRPVRQTATSSVPATRCWA